MAAKSKHRSLSISDSQAALLRSLAGHGASEPTLRDVVPTGLWHPAALAFFGLLAGAFMGYWAGGVSEWDAVGNTEGLLVIERRGAELLPLGFIALAVWVTVSTLGRLAWGWVGFSERGAVVGDYALRVPVFFELLFAFVRPWTAGFSKTVVRIHWLVIVLWSTCLLLTVVWAVEMRSDEPVATRDGIVEGSGALLSWTELVVRQIGCDEKRRRLTYWVKFRDGSSFNLIRSDLGGLGRLVELDGQLNRLSQAPKRILPGADVESCLPSWGIEKRDIAALTMLTAPQ